VILEEIKTLRLHNQHLLGLADVHTVSRDLCGVQAQFLSNAFHALQIRCANFDAAHPDGLMKNWTLRGAMHLFDEEDLPLMLHRGRAHFLRPCDTFSADEWISAERKQFFADRIMQSVRDGISDREALKQTCADAGMTETEAQSVFNPWGGLIRALCEAGKLTHAVSEKKAFVPCPAFDPMEKESAELELARRYFTHYGPATVRDAAYFFGFTHSEIRKLLAQLPVRENIIGEKAYYYIEEKAATHAEPPACIFLAGFDPLMLGYEKKENPFLPEEHLRGIFSMAGIVMPALLVRGRVVGRWKRAGKKLTVTLFETIDAHDRDAVCDEAERLFGQLRSIEGI